MKFFFCLCLITASFSAFAQNFSISGKVTDASSNEPLAFVHVTINDSPKGTTTSIDGRFQITSKQKIEKLVFSYVGYQKKEINVSERQNEILINLTADTKVLNEVEFFAGENPALPIIRKVIEHAKSNNPEELSSFYFKSYNKFFVDGFNQDFIDQNQKTENVKTPDSTASDVMNYLQDKYLFLMESITEKKFRQPDLVNEKVLANKISGLQKVTFATLANSFQPFSFYDMELQILGVKFINPVSKPGTRRYYYELQDSIISPEDTVYILSFEPENAGHELLKGLLYINTRNWAIQNVIGNYENQESLSFKIQQKYEPVDGAWFPVQLNTEVIFNNLDMDEFQMKGIGRSYLYDIIINLPLKTSEFNRMALQFDQEAALKKEEYWLKHRQESMSARGTRTFTYLDSLSREIKLDKIVKISEKLISGAVPVGIIDFPFNRMLKINEVEGVRLGMGLRTNEKLSRYFSLNGYFGYGIRDKGWKYGGGIDLYPLGNKDFSLDLKYSSDLRETGSPRFYQNNSNILTSDNYRNLIIRLMDRVERFQGGVHFYTMKYFDVYASLSKIKKSPYTNQYRYLRAGEATNLLDPTGTFNYTLAGLQIKYARTQYYPFLSQKVPVKSNYPVIFLNYYRGFNNLLGGEYNFNKVDFQLQKRFRLGLKYTDITVNAGLIDRPLPYTEQYFSNGSKTRNFSLYIKNSFATMPLNEFLNDRYASIHIRQDLFKAGNQKFYVQMDGHGSAGWGTLSNSNEHSIAYRTMENGYYETGLSLRFPFLLDSVEWVLGSFYRLGTYRHEQWQDNLSFVYSIESRF